MRALRPRAAIVAVLTLASLAGASSAEAALPGGNGTISYTYTDQKTNSFVNPKVVRVINSTDGADVFEFAPAKQLDQIRPTLDGPYTVQGPIFTSADTRHIALNTNHREYADPVKPSIFKYRDKGAHVGSLDNLSGLFNNGPFHPDLVVSPDLCYASAQVVAALADGTFLWERWNTYSPAQPACNTPSKTGGGTLLITDTQANPIKRVFDYRANKPFKGGDIFASSGEANTIYSAVTSSSTGQNPIGIYKTDLATETTTQLTAGLPLGPEDVTPDGRYLVGIASDGRYGKVAKYDLLTGELTTLLTADQADALQPAFKTGTSTSFKDITASPDGTKVAFTRVNINDKGGRDAIVTVNLDGTGARVVKLEDTDHLINLDSVAWQPGPSFNVELTGDKLVGDSVELDVKVNNTSDQTLSGLTYANGGAPGLLLNNRPFEQKLGLTLAGGPTPALVGDVAPKSSATSQYLFGVDTPGRMFVRADVNGSIGGGPLSSVRSDVLTIDASTRPLEDWEKFMQFSGGYTFMADVAQGKTNQAISDTLKQVETLSKGFGADSPAERKSRSTTSALERGLARRLGVPDDTLRWLPNNPKEALAVYNAFVEAEQRAGTKKVATYLKEKVDKTKYAADFWRNQVFGPDSTHVPVSDFLYKAATEQGARAQSFVKQARDIATGPDANVKMNVFLDDQIYKFGAQTELSVRELKASAIKGAARLGRLADDDPVAAGELAGGWIGAIKGDATVAFIDDVVSPDPGKVLSWAKSGGSLLRKIGVPDIDFSAPSASKLADATDVVTEAVTAKAVPASAKELGMGDKDQGVVARITRELEAEAKGLGYDIDLGLSFRGRNVHSDGIEGGVGKIGLFTTKSGTDLDVMLGMDARALGKGVVYKPKLPKNFDDLDDDMAHALIERRQEMLDEYRIYQAPGSAARKAATKAGTTYENKFQGTTTMKAQVKTKEVYFGETIALKYEKLVIDGRTIVDPKKAGRWMVSDFDGNAVIKAKTAGQSLPAGIRSTIELRLNRKLIAAAEKEGFAYGFHGFTYNGFDVGADKHRKMTKYVLESLDGPERKRMLDKYFKKYGLSDYTKLLESYETGQYVIRVTRDGAEAATGF